MRWIARSSTKLGKLKDTYKWYYRAVGEAPDMRDAHVEFATLAYVLSDWNTCFYMSEQALKIKSKSTSFTNSGYSWDHTPHDLAAISCFNLGLYEKARVHAKAAVELNPNESRLKNNLKLIEQKLN